MYTSGLWDTGDMPSVPPGSGMETQGCPPPPSGDGGDEGARLEPFRVAKKGPGRDVGPQPSQEVPPHCGDSPVPAPADTHWT